MKLNDALKQYFNDYFDEEAEDPAIQIDVEIYKDVETGEFKIYMSHYGSSGVEYRIDTTADAGDALTRYLEEQV